MSAETNDSLHKNLYSEVESMVRDMNLSLILGDNKLTPNLKTLRKGKNLIFNKKYWSIIEKYKDDCIITGSASLIVYGLLSREPRDIDLIPFDRDKIGKLLNNRYANDDDTDDMYGHLRIKGYYVDFFPYTNDIMYNEINGFKIQHPFQVLLKKASLNRHGIRAKDFMDIREIKSFFNVS
jgi:hypothetical protein